MRKLALSIVGALAPILMAAMPGVASAASPIVVTPTNQHGWTTAPPLADNRPPGTVTFVADANAPGGNGALQLTTTGANPLLAAAAKAQYMHPTNTPLSSITELSYYTKQVSAPFPGADPSYQLVTCLNGAPTAATCLGFTTLVFEPYQNPGNNGNATVVNNVWQQWDVDQGLFWSTRTVTCSNGTIVGTPGGPATYTLAQIQSTCPEAVVGAFGVNIGTNNPDYVVRTDLFNFNGTVYDFELHNTPSDKDQCKNGGYTELTDENDQPFKNQGQCVSYANHH